MTKNHTPIFLRYRFWWHVLFWVVVLVVFWLIYAGHRGEYYQEFIINVIQLPAKMIGTYTFIYLILPLATEKRKFVTFGVFVVIHFFLYGIILRASYYFTNPFPGDIDFERIPFFDLTRILTKAASDYVLPGIASAIYFFKRWYIEEQKNKKMAEEKLAAELNFLKAQIHPHFLFNTLNNLYTLTLLKSEEAPDIVLKLSELLDYMIYKSNIRFVPLANELEIVEGYIDLEKMRYSERLELSYSVNGEADKHQIAPLILLPFIENCFKHGASKDRIKPVVDIEINIMSEFLTLKAINSVPEKKGKEEPENEGIGLSNVKRRLELIYPDKYELEINSNNRLFGVELKIFWV
ncbi:sensor histidine kinase [Maribellus comscasis]|uniref:Sensor histidine kinase n=1 Tax=Maribellus comscasis TaxID=2681766 RepID=A0A6I6JZP8_9BACT|nr:histidine kinase [Maribellus comscasis]QGY45727.1 sensor histidine kinase [Maribellus comscasis]